MYTDILGSLKRKAIETYKEYPQYDGYFDDWVLFRVTSTVRFHTAEIEVNEFILGSPEPDAVSGFGLSSVLTRPVFIGTSEWIYSMFDSHLERVR